jgi:hypothetical protein
LILYFKLQIFFSLTNNTISIILQNRACISDINSPCSYNRTFIPQGEETFVLATTNATLAVFFDILENVKIFFNNSI